MKRITQKQLRNLYNNADMVIVKNVANVPEEYSKIAWLEGAYGCNGEIFANEDYSKLFIADYRLPNWVQSK